MIDLYDSEILKIEEIVATLNNKVGTGQPIDAFDREIKERFAEAGFLVDVKWYEFAQNGKRVEGGRMPEIEVLGRIEQESEFDHDRLKHEIVNNILDLPGEGGLIKPDKETERRFLESHAKHSHD